MIVGAVMTVVSLIGYLMRQRANTESIRILRHIDHRLERLEERLAACGQVVGEVRSIYRWQGAVHVETEARVALHTRRSLVPAIVERAGELHPYDVPCVIALPVLAGNPVYLEWLTEETRGA